MAVCASISTTSARATPRTLRTWRSKTAKACRTCATARRRSPAPNTASKFASTAIRSRWVSSTISTRPTDFDRLEGSVLIWFTPGYLAVQGRDLAGAFGRRAFTASSRSADPPDPLEQRLFMALRINDIDGRRSAVVRSARTAAGAARRARSGGRRRACRCGGLRLSRSSAHDRRHCRCGRSNCASDCTTASCDSILIGRPRTGVAGRIEYTALGTTGRVRLG